jgi:hypothetical protein
MLLYRPVGLEELLLMFASDMRAFPPRLPEQPIFYPVTDEGYAVQIARDWNTKSNSLAGYVTRFAVNSTFAEAFPVRTVGAREHKELWVPAQELEAFNAHIEGRISVSAAYFGEAFRGVIPKAFALKGKDATEQFATLHRIHDYSLMDFHGEIAANQEAVYAHFPLWRSRKFVSEGITDAQQITVLRAVQKAWGEIVVEIPLAAV